MVVKSDDGFQVSTGNADNTTYLRSRNCPIGRTVFCFNVESAGVYFFRMLWYEGGGGAKVEWYTVNADGTSTLVNGTETGAIKAYRTRTVPEPELPASTPAEFSLHHHECRWHHHRHVDRCRHTRSRFEHRRPVDAIDGATSPYTFTPAGNAWFGRIRSGANSYDAIGNLQASGQANTPGRFFAHS